MHLFYWPLYYTDLLKGLNLSELPLSVICYNHIIYTTLTLKGCFSALFIETKANKVLASVFFNLEAFILLFDKITSPNHQLVCVFVSII